jgi:hypothetical protein
MVSQFNIFRIKADEFTWQECSTRLEVAKAPIELLGAGCPAQHRLLNPWMGGKISIRDETARATPW